MIVDEPFTHVGRSDLDFGPGFYVTNDREQAEKWAKTKAGRKKNQRAILNIYKFNQLKFIQSNIYALRIFPEYNVDWLDFVSLSRKGKAPWKGLDWIEGGIANDSVISTVDAYVDGMITAEQAMDKLVNENLRHQICICNQTIIDDFVKFEGSIEL